MKGRIVMYTDLTTTARRKSNYLAGKDLEAAIQQTLEAITSTFSFFGSCFQKLQ